MVNLFYQMLPAALTAEHGSAQFKLPDILEVPPFNEWGNVIEIAARFGGGKELRSAVTEQQRLRYTA